MLNGLAKFSPICAPHDSRDPGSSSGSGFSPQGSEPRHRGQKAPQISPPISGFACTSHANRVARETQAAIDKRNFPALVAKTMQTKNSKSFHQGEAQFGMALATGVAAATPFAPPVAASYLGLSQQATRTLTQAQGTLAAGYMVGGAIAGSAGLQHAEMHKRAKASLREMSDRDFANGITELPYNTDGFSSSAQMITDRIRQRKTPYKK